VRLRIEYHAHPRTVFVRRLDPGEFDVPEGALLGGAWLRPHLAAPRRLKHGRPDADMFAVELISRADLALVPVGAEVDLTAASQSRR
jgi:hypothetical protein